MQLLVHVVFSFIIETDSGFSDQYQETTSSNVAMRKQGTQHKVGYSTQNMNK